MGNARRKAIMILVVVFGGIGVILLRFSVIVTDAPVQPPERLPLVVQDSMESILQSLENELAQHRPETIKSLRPGITPEELEQAQVILGQSIHPEMQALYRWHNGLMNDAELFPGHGFLDMESAIQINQELQKKGIYFLLPQEKNWLILFPDAAGDGYYYNPTGIYERGGVFYIFREAGYYRYFPSIKNLLKAITECYQNGAYPQDTEPDFELEDQIMDQYGAASEQP